MRATHDPLLGLTPEFKSSYQKLSDLISKSGLSKETKSLHINSGFRTKEHNRRVGGKEESQHLYGKAADIAVPMKDQGKFIELARQAGFKGIGVGGREGYVHVDVRDTESTWTYSGSGVSAKAFSSYRSKGKDAVAVNKDSPKNMSYASSESSGPSRSMPYLSTESELLTRAKLLNERLKGLSSNDEILNRIIGVLT
jgi:hypothetical protein